MRKITNKHWIDYRWVKPLRGTLLTIAGLPAVLLVSIFFMVDYRGFFVAERFIKDFFYAVFVENLME